MLYSFVAFLLAFVIIGISSSYFSRHSKEDYYLASHNIPPWLAGLSAVATNNSGYMFIGVIGYTYATGLASIWLMIGWIAGDFCASLFIHAKLQQAAIETGEPSYAGVLSHWQGRFRLWQRLAAIISILFLLSYASAQLVAGSKSLQVLLSWPPWAGAVMGAIIVGLYCLVSGIRASIWTDAAQSFVMLLGMGLLMVFAISSLGGIEQTWNAMSEVEGFLDWYPKDLAFPGVSGGILFALSWMFAGLSVIGQPHVMVRFMTLKSTPNSMFRTRLWYYGFFIIFYFMATVVGMLSRIYLPELANFDAELALPTMAQQLFPPVLVGLILAAMFAATMSTADSLVLSCSASLTHDLLPHKIEKAWLLKTATGIITITALVLALMNNQSVFSLVILSWSTLASAFAPILIVLALGGRFTESVAMTMMFCGVITALLWRWFDMHLTVYEGMPGILVGLFVYLGYILIKKTNRTDAINHETTAAQ